MLCDKHEGDESRCAEYYACDGDWNSKVGIEDVAQDADQGARENELEGGAREERNARGWKVGHLVGISATVRALALR